MGAPQLPGAAPLDPPFDTSLGSLREVGNFSKPQDFGKFLPSCPFSLEVSPSAPYTHFHLSVFCERAPVLVVHVCRFTKGLCPAERRVRAGPELFKICNSVLLLKPEFLLHPPQHITEVSWPALRLIGRLKLL